MPFDFAKSATFLSSVAAPTSIVSFSNNLKSENLEPNLITTPLTPVSLIKVFEPAPKIFISFISFLISLINSFN